MIPAPQAIPTLASQVLTMPAINPMRILRCRLVEFALA
jgi:hypothetical protein